MYKHNIIPHVHTVLLITTTNFTIYNDDKMYSNNNNAYNKTSSVCS